jgi:hypothetical protein
MKFRHALPSTVLISCSLQAAIINHSAGPANLGAIIDFSKSDSRAENLGSIQFADEGITLSPTLYSDPNGAGSCAISPTAATTLHTASHCVGNFLQDASVLTDGSLVFFTTPQTDALFLLATRGDGPAADQASLTALVPIAASYAGNVPTDFNRSNQYFEFTKREGWGNQIFLDRAVYSPVAIGIADGPNPSGIQLAPEPGTLDFLGLGALAIVATHYKKRPLQRLINGRSKL